VAEYPPAPWQLAATAWVTVLAVPRRTLPAEVTAAVPDGVEPVTAAGRVLVGVGAVRYAPGGVLAYDELLAGLLCRRGPAPRCTIGRIWVDSPASRDGARALWAIPKELATFAWTSGSASAPAGCTVSAGGRPIAAVEARAGRRLLPGVAVVPVVTEQRLDGRTATAHSRVVGEVRALRARWTFAPDGPLGHLGAGRTVASVAVTRATVSFGLR
jgi:Acetoacetate decarboxylase (ADC)